MLIILCNYHPQDKEPIRSLSATDLKGVKPYAGYEAINYDITYFNVIPSYMYLHFCLSVYLSVYVI